MRYPALVLVLMIAANSLAPGKSFAVLAFPAGLQPGDMFQWVFVTSGELDAISSNINDYNAFVQAQANLNADLTGITFKVIGSTQTVDARDNALVSTPVYRLDGVNVATGFADMWDGSINAAISVNQFNQAIVNANRPVHTGSDEFGVKSAQQKWLGASVVVVGGDAWAMDSTWMAIGQQTPDHVKHYYALSEVLTVSAVPEGSAALYLSLVSLGAGGVAWLKRKVRNRRQKSTTRS